MIRVSVCMIVKNEESCLKECLYSLKSIADEFIIVDTGSSDRTKEIASEFTDIVYDFKWTGNFSDARNFAFEKATGDYIYSADADELLDEENEKKFLKLKETLLPEIEIVQMYYCNQLQFNTIYNFDKELRPKLYKRVRNFVWQEAIHEAVNLEPVIYNSDIEIIHRPKSQHAGRDLAAFERLIKSGEILSARLNEIYAKELFIAGTDENFLAAGEYFKKLADEENMTSDDILRACCIAARYHRIEKKDDAFFQFALRGVAGGSCSEICYEIGEFFFHKKNYSEASIWFYNAVYESEPLLSIKYKNEIPLNRLSKCYEMLGNVEMAEEYQRKICDFVENKK